MEEIAAPRLSFVAEKNELNQVQISISDNGKGISEDVIGTDIPAILFHKTE